MKSVIVTNLRPEFEPVAVVWRDTIPDDARQFKKGKFGCILYLFAEASLRGKVTGGNSLFSKCARAPNICIKPDFAKKPPSRLCKALENK